MFGWVVIGKEQTETILSNFSQTFLIQSESEYSQRFWEKRKSQQQNFDQPGETLWSPLKGNNKREPWVWLFCETAIPRWDKQMAESFRPASRQFDSLICRLEKQPQLYKKHNDFKKEFINPGDIEKVPKSELIHAPEISFYLWHHCFFVDSSTPTKWVVLTDLQRWKRVFHWMADWCLDQNLKRLIHLFDSVTLTSDCTISRYCKKISSFRAFATLDFDIRKWVSSNSRPVWRLDGILRETEDENVKKSEQYNTKTLSVKCNQNPDQFVYAFNIDKEALMQKKQILTEISIHFYPLRLRSLSTLQNNQFCDQFWLMDKHNWDQPISDEILQQYIELGIQIKDLDSIRLQQSLNAVFKIRL